jgi:hypothetical protein
VAAGLRVVRINLGPVIDEWLGPHLEGTPALSSPRSTSEIGPRGLEVRLYRGELAVIGGADVSRNEYTTPARELLGVYLATWLERIKPPHGKIKVSTWKSYESHVRVHLVPDAIADRRVADITATDVEDLFRRLLDKGLSPATVDAVRRTVRRALNAHPKVTANPVRGAASPRVPRHEVDVDFLWTHKQARRFFGYAGA